MKRTKRRPVSDSPLISALDGRRYVELERAAVLVRVGMLAAVGFLMGCDGPKPVTRTVAAPELTGTWLSLNEDTSFQVLKAIATKRYPQHLRLVLFDDHTCEAGSTVVRHAMACLRRTVPTNSVVQCSWNHGSLSNGYGVTVRFAVPNGKETFTDLSLWVMSDAGELSLGRGCDGSEDDYFLLSRP